MEMWAEDEDSWEDQNFKFPYCCQKLICQDNLTKHMGNKHSMAIFLYNFIIFNTTTKNICAPTFISYHLRIKT